MSGAATLRGLAAVLALTAAPAALQGAPASATHPAEHACDVRLNVTDDDPAGLNVRAAPGGAVVATLKARGAWIQAHVVGQAGDWMRIDRAILYDDDLPTGEKVVFHGVGFVHLSKLGFEVLNPGARVRAMPGETAPLLWRAPLMEDKVPAAHLLGCDGEYVQVKVQAVTGWTQQFCSNQRTTCS